MKENWVFELHVSDEEKTSPEGYIHIHSRVYMYFIFLYFRNYWIYFFLFHMEKTGCLLTAWLR